MKVTGSGLEVRSPYSVPTPAPAVPVAPPAPTPQDGYTGSTEHAASSKKKRIIAGCFAGLAVLGAAGGLAYQHAVHLNPFPYSCGTVIDQVARDLHESNPQLRSIKDLKDPGARRIDFHHVVDTTISGYQHDYGLQRHHENRFDRTRGIGPEEFKVFRITAHAKYVVAGDDGDYHLQLSDGHGHELATESPAPGYTCGSPYFDQMKQGREQLDQLFGKMTTPNERKDLHGEMVTVTGVGFWDSAHAGWLELHPILSVQLAGDHVVPPGPPQPVPSDGD